MDQLKRLITVYGHYVIAAFIVITIILGISLTQIKNDPNIQNMLPETMPSRVALNQIEGKFGGTKLALVMVHSETPWEKEFLTQIKQLTNEIRQINGVTGAFSIGDLLAQFPGISDNESLFRSIVTKNPLIYQRIVSQKLDRVAIVVNINSAVHEYPLVKKLRAITAKYFTQSEVVFGGMPFINERIEEDINRDMVIFMPGGILLMLLFLYFSFKEIRGVLLPLAVVGMAIIVAMGLIPIFDWRMQMVTLLLPVILIAVANDYGIHLITHFQRNRRMYPELNSQDLALKGVRELGKPILFAGITTIAGILSLLTHLIIPAKQMGILGAIGILFALIASLLFLPAVLAKLPRGVVKKEIKSDRWHNFLEGMGKFIINRSGIILIGVILIAAISGWGITLLEVDSNPVGFYDSKSEVVQGATIVNNDFGGAQIISLMIKGAPDDLDTINWLKDINQKIDRIKGVGNTLSMVDVYGAMAQLLPRIYKDHDLKSRLALFQKMGGAAALKGNVSDDHNYLQLMIQVQSEGSDALKEILNQIKNIINDDPRVEQIGGSGLIFIELIDRVVSGQIYSLGISLMIIMLLVIILFRSVIAGILAMIPIALALILLFGLMGYLEIPLDISTAMLSAIMIGVGIDYTIHFIWGIQEAIKSGGSLKEAIQHTLTGVGRGITLNGLSVVIGFSVLMGSSFLPIRFFGALIFLSISTCLIGALIILPAMILLFQPRFLLGKVPLSSK